jgi:hypothetical protein
MNYSIVFYSPFDHVDRQLKFGNFSNGTFLLLFLGLIVFSFLIISFEWIKRQKGYFEIYYPKASIQFDKNIVDILKLPLGWIYLDFAIPKTVVYQNMGTNALYIL